MKKSILFICTRVPMKNKSGGQDRSYQILKSLSKKYNVSVLSLFNYKELKNFAGDIESVEYNLIKHSLFKKLFSILLNFIKLPLNVSFYKNNEIQDYLKNNKFDIIFCNNIRTTCYNFPKNSIKVIDYVDCISMNYKKAVKTEKNIFKKIIYFIDYLKTKKYEADISNKFDVLFAITKNDANHIKSKKEIHVLKNYIDIENFNNNFQTSEKKNNISIGFFGKMNYEPNYNAVEWFIKNVYKKLNDKNIEFHIIGSHSEKLLKYKSETIKIPGFIQDINKYLSEMDILIAPMISGSGLQNKVLHYLKFKSLIIVSDIGLNGFDNIEELNIMNVNTSDEYLDLLNNKKLTQKIDLFKNKSNTSYLKKYFSEIEFDRKLYLNLNK